MPPTLFVVGVIPIIFLVFGFLMAKRHNDFSHIAVSVRNFTWYCTAGFIVAIVVGLGCFFLTEGYGHEAYLVGGASFAAVAVAYICFVQFLYYRPLRTHARWFEPADLQREASAKGAPDVDIIKGERLRTYSVADELLKWAKLKEDGHITEEQFNDASSKLLQRS